MAQVTSGSTQVGRTEARPRIGLARQPAGAPVRVCDGNTALGIPTRELGDYVEWVAADPENAIGPPTRCEADRLEFPAGTSRPTLDGCVLTGCPPGRGHSDPAMSERARQAIEQAPDVDDARLGQLPLELPVEHQDRLDDDELRDHFLERVFAHARLRSLFENRWSPRDLMSFQARHKMQLMAHSVEGARRLGRIAARAGEEAPETTCHAYTRDFGRVLRARIAPGGHTNALQHLFGMVSDRLGDARRRDVLDAIERHRRAEAPLSVAVAMVRQHCAAEPGLSWAAEQTYLAPYPAALWLGTHVSR